MTQNARQTGFPFLIMGKQAGNVRELFFTTMLEKGEVVVIQIRDIHTQFNFCNGFNKQMREG
ncbi:hypothetical protein CIT292_09365 [Citrobacter youngae ATCC 29220]|uniref:Uncharacterized protein n=1 Tax=Citrobacter youngae ATCC 29220 TaxID=500640 RepID=D4BEZ9_9ENTR|nr:hypothetical protein CIT292_09365 [Citrobacter youngae ATCC 29220]